MTRLDDSIAVSMFIMFSIGIPFLVNAIPVMASAEAGDYVPIMAFWESGWVPLVVLSLLVSIGVILIGWWID